MQNCLEILQMFLNNELTAALYIIVVILLFGFLGRVVYEHLRK